MVLARVLGTKIGWRVSFITNVQRCHTIDNADSTKICLCKRDQQLVAFKSLALPFF